MAEHKEIWLEPACNQDGRQWCQDNVWGDKCSDCAEKPVKFVRSDVAEERERYEYERGKLHGSDDRKMIERQNQAQGREIASLKTEISQLKMKLYDLSFGQKKTAT